MSDVERVMRNLCILASISQNDKVNTNSDIFVVYQPTVLRGMVRLWYGEGRQLNIQRIQETVHCAISSIRQLMSDMNLMVNEDQKFQRIAHQKRCTRLIQTLSSARNGLNNLHQTYREDITMQSQIKIVIDEIIDFISIIPFYDKQLGVLNGDLLQN
tara:strand:+ start:299 stop:769 length:471 start_codon:yes stop_codon:yes gene_type:complete